MIVARDLGSVTSVIYQPFAGSFFSREDHEDFGINVHYLCNDVWFDPLAIRAR